MFRQGIICDVNINDGTARVRWMEDNVVSNWLSLSVVRAGEFEFYCPFSINEQVWCVLDESGENGVIGGATYNKKKSVPQGSGAQKLVLRFGNNSTITIDGNSESLDLDINGDCSLKSNGNVKVEAVGSVELKAASAKVEAPQVDIQGSGVVKITAPSVILETATVTASGALVVTGAITAASIAAGGFSGPGGGPMTTSSDIQTTGDIIVGTISFNDHVHTAPSGGGITSPPE